MFFGFDPFALIGGNQQQPRRQGAQQPQQQQQRPPQQQGLNIFDNFANFINNEFMNPQQPQRNQQQNQQNNQQARPRFFRQGSKQQKPKFQKPPQPVYNENQGGYWKVKGNQYFKKGQYEKALEMYDKAIDLNNTESVFFSNRARCLKKLNKLESALQDAQAAIQLDQNNIKAHLMSGQILAQIGKEKRDMRKVQLSLKRLTKALTLCANQKKNQFQNQITVYIYRAKKLLWYLKFEQIKAKRIQAINQYKKYIDADKDLSNQQKQQKVENFMSSINELVIFQIPDHLICKITLELMEDPVTTQSGLTYQRSAIQQHIQRNGKTDPFTRKPLKGPLYPSVAIKKAIQEFLQKNPWAYQHCQGQTISDINF